MRVLFMLLILLTATVATADHAPPTLHSIMCLEAYESDLTWKPAEEALFWYEVCLRPHAPTDIVVSAAGSSIPGYFEPGFIGAAQRMNVAWKQDLVAGNEDIIAYVVQVKNGIASGPYNGGWEHRFEYPAGLPPQDPAGYYAMDMDLSGACLPGAVAPCIMELNIWSVVLDPRAVHHPDFPEIAGFADLTNTTYVPEPSKAGSLIAGLLGLGLMARYRE